MTYSCVGFGMSVMTAVVAGVPDGSSDTSAREWWFTAG